MQVIMAPAAQLWNLCIVLQEMLSGILEKLILSLAGQLEEVEPPQGAGFTNLDIALLRVFSHGSEERPRHSTGSGSGNLSVGRRLIISTARKHPHVLPLVRPVFFEILRRQPLRVGLSLSLMVETVEEVGRATQQHLGVLHLVHSESTLKQMLSSLHKPNALLDRVKQVNFAILIGPENEGQLARGAGVAAVEEDGKSCLRVHRTDDGAMELMERWINFGLLHPIE